MYPNHKAACAPAQTEPPTSRIPKRDASTPVSLQQLLAGCNGSMLFHRAQSSNGAQNEPAPCHDAPRPATSAASEATRNALAALRELLASLALTDDDLSRHQSAQAQLWKNVKAPPAMVFIYDIEDITQLSWKNIEKVGRLFPQLVDGSAAFQDLIDFVADMFYWSDEKGRHVMNVKDAALSEAFEDYVEFKEKCAVNGSIISYELLEELGLTEEQAKIFQTVEKFQKMFNEPLQSAKRCLKAICDETLKNNYENVVLAEDHISFATSQLLISGLAAEIPLENLYSTFRKSKEQVLERIQRDFGDQCVLVAVTSNPETTLAAEKLNIPLWRVDDKNSFDELHILQRNHLLE